MIGVKGNLTSHLLSGAIAVLSFPIVSLRRIPHYGAATRRYRCPGSTDDVLMPPLRSPRADWPHVRGKAQTFETSSSHAIRIHIQSYAGPTSSGRDTEVRSGLKIHCLNEVLDTALPKHDPYVAHSWALARSTPDRAAKSFHRFHWIEASISSIRPRIILILFLKVN